MNLPPFCSEIVSKMLIKSFLVFGFRPCLPTLIFRFAGLAASFLSVTSESLNGSLPINDLYLI